MNIDRIYWIGGSPCSGKSTVAELLAQRLGMYYYKLDDRLDEFMHRAAENGGRSCAAYFAMSPDQIWLREPAVQCQSEIDIYWEIFPYAAAEAAKIAEQQAVITEGAGWLPELVQGFGIRPDRYLCIVPSKEFQVEKYSLRPWVGHVLEGCSDKAAAFDNWMERDALFARCAASNAEALGYRTIINDGSLSVEELYLRTAEHFGLN